MNQGWTYQDRIDRAAQGLTVLEFYSQRYCHSSRDQWQQRIETGQIWLNGDPTTAETRLSRGQTLSYHRPPWQEPTVPLHFSLLYEDPDLLVVAKPAGLPVLPGGGFLEHTLLWQLQQRYPQSTPYPIHRLGRGTSGVLLLARSPQARAVLSQQMRDRQIQKCYRALVQGNDMADRLTITQPIGKCAYPILGYLYAAVATGLPAHSEVQVCQRNHQTALLEVTILTGRPHQIRIHLAAAGYPLVGDPLYCQGGVPISPTAQSPGAVPGDGGYWLHARSIGFTHPNGQPMQLTCPPPPELAIAHPRPAAPPNALAPETDAAAAE